MTEQLTMAEIQANLEASGPSPQDCGTLTLIVRRPSVGERELLETGELDVVEGLVGDTWKVRGSRHTEDGSALLDAQIALANSRVMQALTKDTARVPLAGDQLFVDLDLSEENLPPGQQIAIGSAVLEITAQPHTGCDKFTARFGSDAIRFVNSREGRQQRRRGIYARVVQAGTIHTGDVIAKL